MSREKLLVEFDVEKTISRKYGYQEKLLTYRGSDTRYKAIIKDGTLCAILGRYYKLIPNEEVLKIAQEISIARNLDLMFFSYGWRLYCILTDGSLGVMVSNSVDGTIALRCDAVLQLKRGIAILAGTKVSNIYRRHSKTLSIEDLDQEIAEIYNVSKRYKQWLEKLDDYSYVDYYDTLHELLTRNLPKVYTDGLLHRYYIGKPFTIKEIYERIANRIWSRDTDIRTKITLYKKLNDVIMTLGVVDVL